MWTRTAHVSAFREVVTCVLQRRPRPVARARALWRKRMGQFDTERNVLRQRGKQFTQRQHAFAGIARVPKPSLPNNAGLGSPGSSTPSEICA